MGTAPPPQSPEAPRHIAVIMDGNGRWAEARGLPRLAGHRAGAESVREAVDACLEMDIEFLTLYAFSSENWDRPAKEVAALMKLLEQFLKTKKKEFQKNNVRLCTIGRTHLLPESCQRELDKAIAETADNTALTVILALSYGSREELVDATRRIAARVAAGDLAPEDIEKETITSNLDTADFPDPDLLIRTSGELRLSNFLLWQLSYAEFYISNKNWPDFNKADFRDATAEYSRRHRRFGRV